MRELSTVEIGGVSGGTNIYDYRSGTPGIGLPNDPLNTGNTHIDIANAIALVSSGEIGLGGLQAVRPDIAAYIVEAAEAAGLSTPGPLAEYPQSPYPPGAGYWGNVGRIYDNQGQALGHFVDTVIVSLYNAAVGATYPLAPDHPAQIYDFDGCHDQCPW